MVWLCGGGGGGGAPAAWSVSRCKSAQQLSSSLAAWPGGPSSSLQVTLRPMLNNRSRVGPHLGPKFGCLLR